MLYEVITDVVRRDQRHPRLQGVAVAGHADLERALPVEPLGEAGGSYNFV